MENTTHNNNQLTDPSALHHGLRVLAHVVKEEVLKQTITIQGRRYIKVEGWGMLANAAGFIPGVSEVRPEGDGFVATAELRKADTGAVLAKAEGFCGRDEPRWKNAPTYAVRSMAQTRALSKVVRSALASVVPLMGVSDLSATPAEEVPEGGFKDEAPKARIIEATPSPSEAKEIAHIIQSESVGTRVAESNRQAVQFDKNAPLADMAISFGKYKGQTLRTIGKTEDGLRYLEWLERQELKLGKDGKPFKSDLERNKIIRSMLANAPEPEDGVPF
jgi:uncharacterized protein (DUF3820 family)